MRSFGELTEQSLASTASHGRRIRQASITMASSQVTPLPQSYGRTSSRRQCGGCPGTRPRAAASLPLRLARCPGAGWCLGRHIVLRGRRRTQTGTPSLRGARYISNTANSPRPSSDSRKPLALGLIAPERDLPHLRDQRRACGVPRRRVRPRDCVPAPGRHAAI